jgi:hypothetical protein
LVLFVWLAALAMVQGVPEIKGDLDEDGRHTVRDVVRLVNHLQQVEFLHPIMQPFGDVDEDGDIDGDDVSFLMDVVLKKREISTFPLLRPLETSPVRGEDHVSLTRETVVRFSLPLADDAVIKNDDFFASFGGNNVLSRVEISSDRLKATLFYLENLPPSARVRVSLNGDNLHDSMGRVVDMDRDGQPGGTLVVDFETVSITPVPNTTVVGSVFAAERDAQGMNQALDGVVIEVVGDEENTRTTTGADGSFMLTPVPAGEFL